MRDGACRSKGKAFSKQTGGVLHERVAVKCASTARQLDQFDGRLTCEVLEVSPSGYYASRKTAPWLAFQRG